MLASWMRTFLTDMMEFEICSATVAHAEGISAAISDFSLRATHALGLALFGIAAGSTAQLPAG